MVGWLVPGPPASRGPYPVCRLPAGYSPSTSFQVGHWLSRPGTTISPNTKAPWGGGRNRGISAPTRCVRFTPVSLPGVFGPKKPQHSHLTFLPLPAPTSATAGALTSRRNHRPQPYFVSWKTVTHGIDIWRQSTLRFEVHFGKTDAYGFSPTEMF